MRIVKGETRGFQYYEVVRVNVREQLPRNVKQAFIWDFIKGKRPQEEIEEIVTGVAEADDYTGLLVTQEFDEFGNPLYTNGLDTIALDNPCKLLLLAPIFRQAFHSAGFRPKLTQTYCKLKIKYNGPPQTVLVEQPSKEKVEA